MRIIAKSDVRAPIHRKLRWKQINWKKVEHKVKQLQMRIAKATKAGKLHKVKALQWILTHSFYAKLLAVKRVTTNKGKHTPGIDGVVWKTSYQKIRAVYSLKRKGYKALPLRRIYIPKKNSKLRPLSIPCMFDRAMQALYTLALNPLAETLADPNSYGFRRGRRCADAIAQCFNCLSKRYSPVWLWEADIKSCFDEISHHWILDNIPIDRLMLKTWLRAGYIEKEQLYPSISGTAQGGIISPVIMNLTLDGLERAVRDAAPTRFKLGNKTPQVNFIRYADDFIITARTKEMLIEKVIPVVQRFLAERGLVLSAEKSKITRIEDGFNFLGQHLRKYNGKLIIQPTNEAIKGVIAKTRQVIKDHRGKKTWAMIKKLNPIIRGWSNYHRHVCSSKAFSKVDDTIFKNLWNWIRRRHKSKGKKWSRKKYFRDYRTSTWSFFGTQKGKDGKKIYLDLCKANQTGIVRHVKIRAEANPYDPKYQEYFQKRNSRKYTQYIP